MPRHKSVLYQLYKPQLKDVVTVTLTIGNSENIDSSDSEYSVGVSFQYSMEGYVETTSKQSPHWKEDLTFHVDKFHLQDLDIACSKLVFKLKEHRFQIIISKFKEECYLRDILKDQKVIFKDSSKRSMVCITKVEFNHQPDVKVRDQLHLCEDEAIFFEKRTKFVKKELENQQKEETRILDGIQRVPNIAVIGSGGGMRAVVGMCGAMKALKDLGILDVAMYTAGVSGSSWYLSTLYADWSGFEIEKMNDAIQIKLAEAPGTFTELIITCVETFMGQIFDGKHMSLTDIFGNAVGDILLQKNHKQKWSALKGILQKAELPLPLLAAMHVRGSKTTIEKFHEWIECSPYEVFMPKYCTSIDMKYFGSEFNGGFVTKKKPEQSIRFLQGMCGSAYAEVLDDQQQVNKEDDILTRYKKEIEDLAINCFENKCLAKVPNWLHGIPTFNHLFQEKNDMSDTMKEIIDQKNQKMTLADAGTVFNSPYPLVLHPARQVDIIISFDFSQNTDGSKDNVGELIKAQKWAERRGLQFPDVTKEIKTNPIKEDEMMRVFQTGTSPYILHFMMNDQKFLRQKNSENADLEASVLANIEEKKLKSFKTMKLNYSEQEFKWLSALMEFNVKESRELIQGSIKEASKRNQEKKQ